MSDCHIIKNHLVVPKCPEMTLQQRREIMEKQSWISNVKRVLGYSDSEALSAWIKIENAKLYTK